MKKKDVVGGICEAKVSGKLVPLLVLGAEKHGRIVCRGGVTRTETIEVFVCKNLVTGRFIRVRSASRLRRQLPDLFHRGGDTKRGECQDEPDYTEDKPGQWVITMPMKYVDEGGGDSDQK